MKQTKICSMMAALLIAAMSVGFTSCNKDNKEPAPDIPGPDAIMGKWWRNTPLQERYDFELQTDGTFSCVTVNVNLNGIYRITEIEETTLYIDDLDKVYDATLFKMLASGSNDFDQLWVYYYFSETVVSFGTTYYIRRNPSICVHLYSNNELAQNLGGFGRDTYSM